MPKKSYLFCSESVSEGHPDKIADQISDAVLDAALAQEPTAKVACETLITRGFVVVAGEVKTKARLDIPEIVRATIGEIGYTDRSSGFDCRACRIENVIGQQALEITEAVEHSNGEIGAGDQGQMFGYAANETPELMPLPISLAHKLVRKAAQLRHSGQLPWLRPDGKSQVTVRYDGNRPVSLEQVVLGVQHSPAVSEREVRVAAISEIIEQVIPPRLRSTCVARSTRKPPPTVTSAASSPNSPGKGRIRPPPSRLISASK
jgi:S-adenosylmethionine synthetase